MINEEIFSVLIMEIFESMFPETHMITYSILNKQTRQTKQKFYTQTEEECRHAFAHPTPSLIINVQKPQQRRRALLK